MSMRKGGAAPGRVAATADHIIHITTPPAAWRNALPRVRSIVRRAALAALASYRPERRRTAPVAVSVALASDAAVRRLNRLYRGKDKPTNVLSFPAGDEAWPLLGDVVLALGVLRREARDEGKPLAAHLSHLVVHGVLHLLGYDHGREKDAAVMERLEIEILAGLGLPDPYSSPPLPRIRGRRRR